MAENFGEQFTVAREALGLTLGEVASRTKIREEYLAAIERGDLSLPLPDVYIRGFIRNYAKLLKLDVETIMRECPVAEVRVTDGIKRHAAALVESVQTEEEVVDDLREEPGTPKSEKFQNMLNNLKEKASKVSGKQWAIIGGTGVVLLLVLIAIFATHGSVDPFDFHDVTPAEASTIPNKSITLSTTGPVKVVVRNRETLEKIYAGNLPAKVAKTISYYRPIQVFYDRGEHLLIQQDNGEKIYPQPGRGGIEIK